MQKRKFLYKKIALIISLCVLILWGVLGTGTSIAWFSDSSPEIKNIFNFAEFDVELSHRLEDGTYEVVETDTKVFNEQALYEPGYIQVVYLKVKNKGTVPFNFETAVNVTDYTLATNILGAHFNLQDYLEYGIVLADTETALEELVATREKSEALATAKLGTYPPQDPVMLEAGKDKYMAVIVRMPKNVDNYANFRGTTVPTVEMGINVTANQIAD